MNRVCLFWVIVIGLGQTPADAAAIHDAVKRGDLAAVTVELDNGADINQAVGRNTPLTAAITGGNIDVVRLLIVRGADVNLSGRYGGTPLQLAAQGKNESILEVLLAHGAKPDLVKVGYTPLQTAAENGCMRCVQLLVEAGADVNLPTADSHRPPIHFAKINHHDDIVSYLTAHGVKKPDVPPISGFLKSADPKVGDGIFHQICTRCHLKTVSYGPPLRNVVGRKRASFPGFSYSSAMKAEDGTWTYAELNAFIFSPMQRVPGTEMAFEGIQDDAKRAAVIAYLRTMSDVPPPLPPE